MAPSSPAATGAALATPWGTALAVVMVAPTLQWAMALAMVMVAAGLLATGDTGPMLSTSKELEFSGVKNLLSQD